MDRGNRFILWMFILIILAGIIIFCEGCSCKQTETTKTVISTDVVKVDIPVACQFPKVVCDFSGDGFEPTEKLLDCIITQKRLMDACTLEGNTTAE